MRFQERLRGDRAVRRREEARLTEEWRKQNTFLFGALEVPTRFAEWDFILSGSKGTGKTTAMIALMVSRIEGLIASGRPFNVVAYTPKPDDFYPVLKTLFEPMGISVRSTNPFMKDSWAWDGSLNLTDPPKIDELCAAVIKESGHEQNPFFKKSAQLLLRGVVQSLATTHPKLWTMRQVVACMKDLRLMEQVLARCEHTSHLLTFLSERQGSTAANLHATLLAELKNLEVVASLIDETPDDRRFSLVDAANSPGVITVWGSDPRYNATLEPWNACQLELIGHELLIRGNTGMTTLVFIDEFSQMNGGARVMAIKKLLEFGRSSGVRSTLAIQSPAQVVETWGEKEADTILGQCHGVMIFTHKDVFGQEYWSKRFGRMRGFEEKHSSGVQTNWGRNSGSSPGSSTGGSYSTNVSIERYDLERVPPDAIGDLPVGTYELGMFGYASLPLSLRLDPTTGFPEPIKWRFTMTPEWIARYVPKIEGFPAYKLNLKPEENYTSRPLDAFDYAVLGLKEPPKPSKKTRPKIPKKFPKKNPA